MHKEFFTYQGDFNCGASSKADFILNYFLKFPQISSQMLHFLPADWQAGTIIATLSQIG